ncbi:MAG TPA: Flp pilus assembly protein CpaB [Armatimonadetes bacterium]|nr:Flp pilus assembly protein CpaB [Armatimonadota bacterium]
MNRMLIIGLGLVVGLGILTVIFFALRRQPPKPPEKPKEVEVVIARQAIPPGRPISGALIDIVKLPESEIPPDALHVVDDVVGRIPVQVIKEGEVIRNSVLLVPASIARGYEVPLGARAVAIYVTPNSSTADIVLPGDIVDVFAIYRVTPQGAQAAAEGTRTVLLAQGAQVLAVDKITEAGEEEPVRVTGAVEGATTGQPTEEATKEGAALRKPQIILRRVVLSVSPTQAERILGAAHTANAELDLAVRNEYDTSILPELEARARAKRRKAVARKPRRAERAPTAIVQPMRPPRIITVYRGTNREEVILTE